MTRFFNILTFCLVCLVAQGEVGHDETEGPISNPRVTPKGKPPKSIGDSARPGCNVSPPGLAEFANGEAYDFQNEVSYLTNPDCLSLSRTLGEAAITHGVKFGNFGTLKLENLAGKLDPNDKDAFKRLDVQLSKSVPAMLRENPMNQKELLPLIGQLAVVSPTAARASLVALIQQEIYTSDSVLQDPAAKGTRDQTLNELAKNLVKMGAAEPVMVSELASSVEEMAILSQADSLGKIFRSLGPATAVEPNLAPAFNMSAGALTRGVQRGKAFYPVSDRANLLKVVFTAIQASLRGTDNLENGAVELNEAYQTLAGGFPLKVTILKEAWREAIRILALTSTQPALATAVALSLREDSVYLPQEELRNLVAAGRNYPEIAGSLQSNYLRAWGNLRENYASKTIKKEPFEQARKKFFEPLMLTLLELGPERLDLRFLRVAWRHTLIPDDEVEKRFPRFMLTFLDKREKAVDKLSRGDADLEATIAIFAESFGVNWAVSSLYAPALHDWVAKYDSDEQ